MLDNYDILREIWGGSPCVTSIRRGLTSQLIESEAEESEGENETADDNEECVAGSHSNISISTKTVRDKKLDNTAKRLPAHQRDMMLFNLAREELEVKKQMSETIQQSIIQNEHMTAMTKSITDVGIGIKEGLTLLAKTFQSGNPGTSEHQLHNQATYHNNPLNNQSLYAQVRYSQQNPLYEMQRSNWNMGNDIGNSSHSFTPLANDCSSPTNQE